MEGMADRGGGVAASIGIGNYKGVMLCNRPFGGLAAAAKVTDTSAAGGKGPFRCGCIADEIGIQVTKEPKPIRRTKKATALTRHRQWLSELQKTKDLLEVRYLEEVAAKEEKKKKFEEHEARMRLQIRKVKEETMAAAATTRPESKEERPETNEEPSTSPPASAGGKSSSQQSHKRPKWAMTQGEAGQAEAREEDQEAQDLVAFAKGLDFDKYIEDMEIKTMMEQVAKRISELEVSESKAQERERARAEAKKNLRITSLPLSNQDEEDDEAYSVGSEDEEEDDEVLALAKGVLKHRNVQRIHSARSAVAMVTKSLEKGLPPVPEQEGLGNSKVAEPKIVRIDEESHARLIGKKTPSQLPYLNRNPAI